MFVRDLRCLARQAIHPAVTPITPDPDRPAITFGERLRQLRLAAGITQQALATAIGVGFPYVSKLEKPGGAMPGAELIAKIAAHLKLDEATTTELFTLAEKIPPAVEQLIAKEPEAMDFYRVAHRRVPEEKRREFFRSLIEKLEREHADEPPKDEEG